VERYLACALITATIAGALALPLASLAASPLNSPDLPLVSVSDSPDHVELRTAAVTVRIDRRPWHLTIATADGTPIVGEVPEAPPPGAANGQYGTIGYVANGRWFHATALLSSALDPDGGGLALTAATDDPTGRTLAVKIQIVSADVVRVISQPTNPTGVARSAIALTGGADEHYFGLGEQFASVDQRGRTVINWVRDRAFADEPGTYKPIPFFVSNRGYGLVVENDARSIFEMASVRSDAYAIQVDDNRLQFSIIHGPAPLTVLSRYADLVGHWPLPPAWAFGVWRTSIGGQDRVLAEARRLRALHVPVTALFVYDAVNDDLNLGWPWHIYGPISPGWYPDIPAMNAALHQLGYHVLGYLRADVSPDRSSFGSLARAGYFVHHADGSNYLNRAGSAALDFTNPSAVAWWTRVVRYILQVDGFDGWMQDFGELAPSAGVYASAQPGAVEHNRYPLLYARATYQAAIAAKPDYVSFARSASLGAQSYLRLNWPGDQSVDWSRSTGLPSQIPAMLSAATSGLPDYGPDVGGFADPPGGTLAPAAEKELWIRWVELGALSPTLRDLLGARARGGINVWTDADTQRVFRDYARLHLSLIPYIYHYAQVASDTGAPIIRPLFLEAPADPTTYAIDDEFFLGDSLLVCPVVTPGARERRCYLPAGSWTDFWTGQTHQGPGWVTLPAPLERVPLLARTGATIPLADPDAVAANLAAAS
jgi:alpha-D-xyloside xylohydrolase